MNSHELKWLSDHKQLNNQTMEQLHAHEVLHMMEGNSYSEASLKAAIIAKVFENQHYICG